MSRVDFLAVNPVKLLQSSIVHFADFVFQLSNHKSQCNAKAKNCSQWDGIRKTVSHPQNSTVSSQQKGLIWPQGVPVLKLHICIFEQVWEKKKVWI